MDINNPIFQNEDSARHYLEAVHWPEGPSCPHCGEAENVMKLEGKKPRQVREGKKPGPKSVVVEKHKRSKPSKC